jgi:hypothetical protein
MAKDILAKSGFCPKNHPKIICAPPLFRGDDGAPRDADAMVAGLVHTTEDVVLASQLIIGLFSGDRYPSSLCVLEIPDYGVPKETPSSSRTAA